MQVKISISDDTGLVHSNIVNLIEEGDLEKSVAFALSEARRLRPQDKWNWQINLEKYVP